MLDARAELAVSPTRREPSRCPCRVGGGAGGSAEARAATGTLVAKVEAKLADASAAANAEAEKAELLGEVERLRGALDDARAASSSSDAKERAKEGAAKEVAAGDVRGVLGEFGQREGSSARSVRPSRRTPPRTSKKRGGGE